MKFISNKMDKSATLFPYASFGRRLVAYIFDAIILVCISQGIQAALGYSFISSIKFLIDSSSTSPTSQTQAPLYTYIIGFVLSLLYFIGFWIKQNGQTPGKRLMHIRLVKEDNSPIDLFTALIRWVSQYLSASVMLLGYIWVLFDSKKQAWHDKIAKTYVVESDDQQPSKAVYALGCLIPAILFISFISVGFIAGIKQATTSIGVTTSKNSFVSSVDNLKPETKKLWDRSQELFKYIKASSTDRAKVISLNDENISVLKKAITLEPGNARLWSELEAAYTWASTNGTLEDSLTAAQKALDLEPDNYIYINNVGDQLNALGRFDEASLMFQKTLRITDKSGYAYKGLGISYFNLKIYDQAKIHLTKALAIFQNENKAGDYDTDILTIQKYLATIK